MGWRGKTGKICLSPSFSLAHNEVIISLNLPPLLPPSIGEVVTVVWSLISTTYMYTIWLYKVYVTLTQAHTVFTEKFGIFQWAKFNVFCAQKYHLTLKINLIIHIFVNNVIISIQVSVVRRWSANVDFDWGHQLQTP